MVSEMTMIYVMAVSLALFALGGTGFKWARRYILPAYLGLVGASVAPWLACVGYTITLCLFLCLGYGERASWWYRALIFTGYGASSLWLGWSWWVVITPPVCLGLFFLSDWKITSNSFTWKCVEGAYGFLVACCYINAILNRWSLS